MKWYERYAQWAKKHGLSYLIMDKENQTPYLERFYLLPRWLFFGYGRVVIHCFWRSDNDEGLHDHPWPWASLILSGGYREHTPKGIEHRKPGDFSGWRKATDLHRVELDNEGDKVWTLFFMGPRQREWGFIPYEGENKGKWIQWKEYLESRTSKLDK